MITRPLPYVGPLIWHPEVWPFTVRRLPCAGRGCRVWMRWGAGGWSAGFVFQHGGDPLGPPTEAILPAPWAEWRRPTEAHWQQLCDWLDAVHAYEAATPPAGRRPR